MQLWVNRPFSLSYLKCFMITLKTLLGLILSGVATIEATEAAASVKKTKKLN